MRKISILDTTLRDGAQGLGISYSVEDKIAIVKLLDKLGVEYIEAGNPASNPKDVQLFAQLKKLKLANSKLVAFGSTRRKNRLPEEDEGLNAMLKCGAKICTVFGKAWLFQVEEIVETSPEENLRMIEESCSYLTQNGIYVIFDAEHFFDGFADNEEYAIKCLKAAVSGGAKELCLCDTNGGAFPNSAEKVVKNLVSLFAQPIGVHFHNDCGMAVANSVICALAGADQIQGTLLGTGERSGNANLSAVIANLQIKLGISCIDEKKTRELTAICRELDSINNMDFSLGLPFVGENAFFHKAGMHAAGVLKNSRSFEHINPELVGNKRKFPTSEISGRAIINSRIKELLPNIKSGEADAVLIQIKELELKGYQFEGADASFKLLVWRNLNKHKDKFKLINYKIYTGADENNECSASATVKIKVGDTVKLMAAEGNGPVNALDSALRKALEVFYPHLSTVKLTDYKVRVLDSHHATAAKVRVLITSTQKGHSFTTVGVSGDVVDASCIALSDSFEYALAHYSQAKKIG